MANLTEKMLKNKLEIIWEDNDCHCCKLKLDEPLNATFVFQFPNGDKVECTDCKSLQDFIDKLNRYSNVKEENARLKELLRECLPIVSAEIMSWQIRGGQESHQRGKELLAKINEVL